MSKPIPIQTTLGNFTIDPRQFAGCKPCSITDGRTGKVIEGTEILVSIGAVPGPVHEVMRRLADQLEELTRPALVIPIVGAPRGPAETT
jgi:hypothetical protein